MRTTAGALLRHSSSDGTPRAESRVSRGNSSGRASIASFPGSPSPRTRVTFDLRGQRSRAYSLCAERERARRFCRHAHFTRMRSLRGHFGWQKRAGGKAVGYGTPCFPNGIPRRKYSEYYRQLGMHGKSATMKIWAA